MVSASVLRLHGITDKWLRQCVFLPVRYGSCGLLQSSEHAVRHGDRVLHTTGGQSGLMRSIPPS